MSTYESKELARYYLRTITRRSGYLWLVLFLIMGLSMADMAQYAGLAEGASTATATVAATGTISGKILDQGGKPLTNIQVLALKQSTTTSGGYSSPPPYGLSIYSPWTPEELSTSYGASGYGYGIYGATSYSYGYSYGNAGAPATDTSSLYRALSKADGTFLLSNLTEGRYSLWAYDPQGRGFEPVIFGLNDKGAESNVLSSSYYYPYSSQSILIKVKSGQTAGPFSMAMTMGGKLSGRITDAGTGSPIKGAIVQANAQPTTGAAYGIDILPLLASSDINGNFTFSGLPEGKVLVNASVAEGYMTTPGPYYASFEENTYSVLAGQETSGCNLALKRSGTVSGKVTSQADGKPVAGAEISCFMTSSGTGVYYGYQQSTMAISAADGTYRISGLDTCTCVPVILHAPGFQDAYYPSTQDPSQAKEIRVEFGKETASINFQLIPSKTGKGIIRGRIIDKESGLPAAGIQVNLSQVYVSDPYAGYPTYGYPSYADVIFMKNRAKAVVSDSTPASATGGANTYATTAYATTASASTILSSSVAEPMAAPPVPGDTVVASTTPMPTTFISYISSGYPASIPMEPSSSSGYSLPALSDLTYTYINPVWTDQEGNFKFTGLEYGKYSLDAYDPAGWYLYGHYPEYYSPTGYTTLPYVELSEKQSTSGNIEITLRRGGRLEGKVLAGSTPLAGMQVMVTGKDYNPYGYPVSYYGGYGSGVSDTTDTAGEFTVYGLEEGEYVLLAQNTMGSQNYANAYCLDTNAQGEKPRVFTVTADSSATDLVISMKTGASITGKVVDKTGKPLAGISVSVAVDWDYDPAGSDQYATLYYSYLPTRYAMTAEDGTYTVSGLSEGTYTLNTMNSNDQYQGDCCSGIKVTPPAKVSAPDLVLSKSMVLSGRITSQDGQPLANIQVTASFDYYSSAQGSDKDQNGSSSCSSYHYTYDSATTAEDGTYRITRIAAGSYLLDVYDQTGEYLSGQRGPNGEYLSGPLNAGSALSVITGAEGEVKTNMDLQLVKAGTIKGIIRDAATGKPVSGLTVTAQMEPANDPYATALYATSGNSSYDYDPYGTPTLNPYYNYRGMPEVNGEQAQPDGQGVVDSASTGEPVRTAEPVSSMVMFVPPSTADAPAPMPTATAIGYYPEYYPSYGYSSYGSGQIYSSTPSDSQGNYTLHGLCAGKYTVYITDTAGKNYMSQYYAGGNSADEATVLEVNTAQTIENIDFILSAGIIIKGTVKDAVTGQPITGSGCMVTLTNEQGVGVKQAYTGSFGEYKFTGIRPGTYAVMVGESQYYYYGYYLKMVDYQQVPIYTITISLPGPVEGIDILLEPKASISGRVVDEYDRKPLANITVTAMTGYQGPMGTSAESSGSAAGPSSSYYDPITGFIESYPTTGLYYDPYSSFMPYASPYYQNYQHYQSATTDADGRYTLKGVGEGSYMIMASDYSHIYGSEYYKDVPANQPDKANLVQVGRSENKAGIDLALQVGATYTGADTTSSVTSYPTTGYYPTTSYSYGGLYGGMYGGLYGSSYATSSAPYGYASSTSYLSSSGSIYGASSTYGGTAALTIADGSRQAQWYTTDPYAQSGVGGLPPTVSTQLPTEAPGNISAPEIVSSNSVEKITAGRTFTYQVKVNESAANTSLKYSLTHAPEGMNIDSDSGVVQWKPSNSDAGQAIVQLKVDNGSGQVALQAFRLGVEADTKPPEEVTALKAVKGDQKVTISWKPCANSDGDLADQILYFNKEGNAAYGPGISLGKATARYTVETLENGKAYTFKITTRDELANESSGVTAAATPAKEQAAYAGNQLTSWYPLSGLTSGLFSPTQFNISNASNVSLWGVLPSSVSSLNTMWNLSSYTALGWPSSNWLWYNVTSLPMPVWSDFWYSGLGFSNLFTNQDYRTQSLQQPWNLSF